MLRSMDDTRTLADGTRLVLRDIAPSDAPKLRRAFHELSPESRYQRFMGQVADLTPSMLEYLTDVDQVDHVALIALRLDPEEREHEIVAVARLIRTLPGSDTAEVAVTVADAWQGRGLGACMLQALLEVAPVEQLLAHALPSNTAIRSLLRRHGHVVEVDGVLTVRLPERPHGLARVVARVAAAIPYLSRLRTAA